MSRFCKLFLSLVIAISVVLGCAVTATAQETERARYVLSVPPGFVVVDVSGVKALCEPADRKLVEETLSSIQPATRPSTMPVDLIAHLQANRADAVKQLCADYAITDPKSIDANLDQLLVTLKRFQDFQPPLFYLCTSDVKLKDMLKTGAWTTPGIYFNKLADQVMYRETVPLSLDGQMDDTVIAVITKEGAGAEAMQAKLRKLVNSTNTEVQQMVSGRGMFLVQASFIDAVMKEVFNPMKLPLDQEWFGVGLAGVTSADYSEKVIGSPRHELLLLIAAELRRNPVRMETIDLLKPAKSSELKRQYVVAYGDAYRRKSMTVATRILEKGREKLPELITSMREKPCTSGDDLVQRVKQISGVDISAEVHAK